MNKWLIFHTGIYLVNVVTMSMDITTQWYEMCHTVILNENEWAKCDIGFEMCCLSTKLHVYIQNAEKTASYWSVHKLLTICVWYLVFQDMISWYNIDCRQLNELGQKWSGQRRSRGDRIQSWMSPCLSSGSFWDAGLRAVAKSVSWAASGSSGSVVCVNR